ncbi:hypothetical protein AJ80_09554 [Polytolypa hystricis UAMH7299]|uniref:Patatin-like phospholipase domain-containing protein n=1 Tax=Polytolypa hystricis (strain UAMH7299) TaxID=1447883 RepID=A0A2B7WG06_POLH7|nr:hypothetical protein AJ80_09554 [Polytolypa hystricis UAMH7299]
MYSWPPDEAASLVNGPTIIPTACQQHGRRRSLYQSPNPSEFWRLSFIQKYGPLPLLSLIVRDSVALAGSVIESLRSVGLSKEEREVALRIEERKKILYARMQEEGSLQGWLDDAMELDELEGNNIWKEDPESDEYDSIMVQTRLRELEEARLSCDVGTILHLIRTSLHRNLGNMTSPGLYMRSHVGSKDLIDQYITTASETLSTLLDVSERYPFDPWESRYILEQLLAARQAFGRSALLLSGGATFGMNHIGVVKTLWETRLLPRIVSGSSAGSIIGAVICTSIDEEIPEILANIGTGDFAVFESENEKQTGLQKLSRLLKQGALFDIAHLTRVMRDMLGDVTFKEAYNRTRKVLNICVSTAENYELPRLLNYITSPDVLVWSAVATSCCAPVIFSESHLVAKDSGTGEITPWHDSPQRWLDGSIDADLPMTRLSEMFNINHFIVSQVNPHVVPFIPPDEFFRFAEATMEQVSDSNCLKTLTRLGREEAFHRMSAFADIGFFPKTFRKLSSVVSQKYYGDINILPATTYQLLPYIVKNPSPEFMVQACLCGERATWPKLNQIRNHCAIELALDRTVQVMRGRVAFSEKVLEQSIISGKSFTQLSSEMAKEHKVDLPRRRSHDSESQKLKGGHHARHRPGHSLRKSRSSLSGVDFGLGIFYPPSPEEGESSEEEPPPPPCKATRKRQGKTASKKRSAKRNKNHELDHGFEVGSDSELENEGWIMANPVTSPSASPIASPFVSVSPWFSSKQQSPVARSRRSSSASMRDPLLSNLSSTSLNQNVALPAMTLPAMMMTKARPPSPPSPEQHYR